MTKIFGKLATRVLVAIIGIPLIIVISLYGRIPFLVFATAIGTLAYYEFAKMARNRRYYANRIIGLICVIAIIANEYFQLLEFKVLSILMVILLLIFELFRNKESAIANLGASLVGVFFIGLFSSALINLREFYNLSTLIYVQGGYLILSIFVSIWLCDSAAYFLGTALGYNKLMPRISPNKSWEGSLAGFIFSIITMLACKPIFADFLEWRDAIVIGLIIGTFGQLGDLIESLLKRDAHVKDSSSLIPGHGGIMDRFDSLLFAAPIIYLYLSFLTK
jgi:phosphatidate cytidylyltransferase